LQEELPVVRKVIILTDHRRRNPFPLMSKGERNFIKGKHHHRGSFVYEVSVFPSMTKGEIVGYIVIDVNSRCDDLLLMMNYLR
jgi:hypothetical protein